MADCRLPRLLAILLISSQLGAAAPPEDRPGPTEPRDSGIRERTGRRLIQLRVSVTPKRREDELRAPRLSKSDFIVRLGFDPLSPEQFEIDNLCRGAAEQVPRPATTTGDRSVVSGASVVLYLDYPRLGLEARENSRAMAERLIPELVADGNRVRLVADRGRALASSDWSTDAEALVRSLSDETGLVSAGAEVDASSLRQGIDAALRKGSISEASDLARRLNLLRQRELGRGGDQFLRLLDELDDVPVPKSVIYFADQPYSRRADVAERAVLSGVNIYGVKADGLTAAPFPIAGSRRVPGIIPLANESGSIVRMSHRSLSERTGGRTTYGGSGKGAARRLLESLRSDLQCVYVLSLKTEELEAELSLPVRVGLRPELQRRLRIRTTPRITVPSEARERQQEVERAFESPIPGGVHPAVLTVRPLKSVKSGIRVLFQFAFDPDPALADLTSTWDLGISDALRPDGVADRNVRVVSRKAPRIVFEALGEIPLAPYALVAVAREIEGPGLARGVATGSFARPPRSSFGFSGPLEVLQGRWGAFVSTEALPETAGSRAVFAESRADERPTFRKSGWLATFHDMVVTDRPTLLVGLLCRGKRHRNEIRVAKKLSLGSGTEIAGPDTVWPAEEGATCTVVESWIDAGKFPWEGRPYEVTYTLEAADVEGGEPAVLQRTFWVIGPADPTG